MKINQFVLMISIVLAMSILSGCTYIKHEPPYPANTPYQNTPYQEKYYPLRLVAEKAELGVGYTWNVGSGYDLTIQAIDAKVNPRQVWLSLFKDGRQVDDNVLTEGETYNYQNMFQTTVSNIYISENTDRVILVNTKIYP